MIAEQQQPLQEAKAVFGNKINLADRKSPTVTTGENIYVVCWNGTEGKSHTNGDLFFRSSTDNGVTFSDKINLSNTTNADSIDAEITADGDDVVVTWWERNITSICKCVYHIPPYRLALCQFLARSWLCPFSMVFKLIRLGGGLHLRLVWVIRY